MSDTEEPQARRGHESDNEPSRGPSLTLLYSLIALALAAAIAIAGLIVLPFYLRR